MRRAVKPVEESARNILARLNALAEIDRREDNGSVRGLLTSFMH